MPSVDDLIERPGRSCFTHLTAQYVYIIMFVRFCPNSVLMPDRRSSIRRPHCRRAPPRPAYCRLDLHLSVVMQSVRPSARPPAHAAVVVGSNAAAAAQSPCCSCCLVVVLRLTGGPTRADGQTVLLRRGTEPSLTTTTTNDNVDREILQCCCYKP